VTDRDFRPVINLRYAYCPQVPPNCDTRLHTDPVLFTTEIPPHIHMIYPGGPSECPERQSALVKLPAYSGRLV